MTRPIRIGAVSYLNSKPLIYELERLVPRADLRLEVPSRLADQLGAGELDVALIPSIEYFRGRDHCIVPGMAIAAHGPVLSVKLYCRVPVKQVRTLALDEGSRTSVALTRILLERSYRIQPVPRPLPLGVPAEETNADAVLVIGDRAIRPLALDQVETYDLGEEWLKLTGLPFVFAMWVARQGTTLRGVDRALHAAKQLGTQHVAQIARRDGPAVGLSVADAERYLSENIHFDLAARELEGLELFYRWAAELDLAPKGVPLVFYGQHLAQVCGG